MAINTQDKVIAITFKLDADMHQILEKIAREEDRPMSNVVRVLIKESPAYIAAVEAANADAPKPELSLVGASS